MSEGQYSYGEVLTRPSQGVANGGRDNANSDLILRVGEMLHNAHGEEFVIQGLLGQGTYGQVVKCIKRGNLESVAIKIIKNDPAYLNQAQIEVSVLQMLNQSCDPEDEHHIVRLFDTFTYANHLCLVFELLRLNLFEVIQKRGFKGLDLNTVRELLKQMLDCLEVLRDAGVIHSDLKPENVLIKGWSPPDIKVIDFGSACYENRTVYQYVQSRFYRSPEVILGAPPYTAAIDMWSLGCVAAELFLGLPLFPGAGGYDMIERITSSISIPPNDVIERSKFGKEFFEGPDEEGEFQISDREEYRLKNGQEAMVGKNYFSGEKLADIVFKWGMERQSGSSGRQQLDSFLDFLYGILDPNPDTRWTPRQALHHPFILGESFFGPHVPEPDPIRPHIRQSNRIQQGVDMSHSLGNMQWSVAAQQAQLLAQAQALAFMQLSPGSWQPNTGSLQQLSFLQSQIAGSQSQNFSVGSFPVGSNILLSNLLSSSTPQNGLMTAAGSAHQFVQLGASFQQMTNFLQQQSQQQLQQQLYQQRQSQSSCGSFNQMPPTPMAPDSLSTSQDSSIGINKHATQVNDLKKMNSSTRTMASVDEEGEMAAAIPGGIEEEGDDGMVQVEGGSNGGVYLSPSAEAEWNPLLLDEGEEKEERESDDQQQQIQLDQDCQIVEKGGESRGSVDVWKRKSSALPVPGRGRSKSFHWINDSCESLQQNLLQSEGLNVKGDEQDQKEKQQSQPRRIQRNLTFADFGSQIGCLSREQDSKREFQEKQFISFEGFND